MGCNIWYSKEAVPYVTAHPSRASVPASYYSMWQYNCLKDICRKFSEQTSNGSRITPVNSPGGSTLKSGRCAKLLQWLAPRVKPRSQKRGLYAIATSFCLSVRLSPMKFVKSFATWQHLAGAYRIDLFVVVQRRLPHFTPDTSSCMPDAGLKSKLVLKTSQSKYGTSPRCSR